MAKRENVRENVLEEALRITSGDRARAYGDALADARRFAQIASAVTGLDVRPHHFPLMMCAVKLSRASQAQGGFHRDSWVDLAGYARVAEKVFDRQCEEDDIADVQKSIRESGQATRGTNA
jgi:hypothetical protein